MTVYQIRVVLFEREPGYWVAQCLEHDIGAQAKSLPELAYNLQRSLVGHFAICQERGLEVFADLPRAPPEYWEMWDRSESRFEPEKLDFRPIQPELRVAA